MSSAGDLSDVASQKEDEEQEDNNEQEDNDQKEDDDEDQKGSQDGISAGGSKRHVTFKESEGDTIQAVYKEVNSISSNIDQFLIKLQRQPISKNDYNSQFKYKSQLYGQSVPIYPNYSQMMSLQQNYQKQILPVVSQQQQNYQSQANFNDNNSKFFYSKQDMASARQLQNSQTKYMSNKRNEQSMNFEQNQSQMSNSKYNYYGNYRHQTDRVNRSLQQNRSSQNQQQQNQQQPWKTPLSKRQTLNEINPFNNTKRQLLPSTNYNSQNNQNNGSASQYYNRNIGDINLQIEQLAQSIHQDTATKFYQSTNNNPSLYQGSISKQQSFQKSAYNPQEDSLNQRSTYNQNPYNTISSNKLEPDDYLPPNSSKLSHQNSFNISKASNTVRDLYRYRPKRVIDESELYGEIQQTFIPNKTSVLRSNY